MVIGHDQSPLKTTLVVYLTDGDTVNGIEGYLYVCQADVERQATPESGVLMLRLGCTLKSLLNNLFRGKFMDNELFDMKEILDSGLLDELKKISPQAARAWEMKELENQTFEQIVYKLSLQNKSQLGSLLRFSWEFLYWSRQPHDLDKKFVASFEPR